MLINRRKVCVHDETWKECEVGFSFEICHIGGSDELQRGHQAADFIAQIEEEYDRLNAR